MRTKLLHIVWLAFVAVLSMPTLTLAADNPKLLAIGDSIGNGHRIAIGWPKLIERELGVAVFNRSLSNRQTDWGLSEIDALLSKHEPSHVLILLGANDAVHADSLEQSAQNLQEMADKANQAGAHVFVSTLLPITYKDKYNQRSKTLSEKVQALKGVTVVDARASFNEPDNLLVDGLHPNQEGQNLIAHAFLLKLDIAKNEALTN